MPEKLITLLFVLILSLIVCASAVADKIEKYKGNIIFDGTETLTIKQQKKNKPYIELIMDSDGCAGGIEGVGKVDGDTIILTDKYEDKTCRISIHLKGDTAEIKETEGCFFWHGAPKGCVFNRKLYKVK